MVALDFPDAPTTGQLFEKWVWNGTQWVLTPRAAFGAVNSGTQSWASFATASMNWPTEAYDTHGFGAGGAAVTVPAAVPGIYSISSYVAGTAAMVGYPTTVAVVLAGTVISQTYIPVGTASVFVASVTEIAAGQAVQIQITSGHNAAMTYSGRFTMVRVSL